MDDDVWHSLGGVRKHPRSIAHMPKMMDVFYRVWYMSHSITRVLGDETMQMYGNFQGFCLQYVHCLGW